MGYIEAKEAELVPGLTPAQKLVLIALCNRANWDTQDGTTFYGQGTLAAELGLGIRTVNGAMKHLADQNYIKRTKRYRQGTMSQATRTTDTIWVNKQLIVRMAADHKAALLEARAEEPDTTNRAVVEQLGANTAHSLRKNGVQLTQFPHVGYAESAQLNKEPNKELEQERDRGVSSARNDAHRRKALDLLQAVAKGEADQEQFENFLYTHYEQALADYFCGSDQWCRVPKKAADRYEAGAFWNKLLSSFMRDSTEPSLNEEEERTRQLARLEQFMNPGSTPWD